MSKVTAVEREDGVIIVRIPVAAYGDAGLHWRTVLGGSGRARFGSIYLQRFDATERREASTYYLKGIWEGTGLDRDECPGAMFIFTGCVGYDVREVSAHMNRKLGSDMRHALSRFEQPSPSVLRPVEFEFE
jgi:hypothetical protein